MRTEEEITEMVVTWCNSRPDTMELPADPGVIGYTFDILDFAVNVQRVNSKPWTRITSGVVLGEDDLDYYELVGEHDFKVIVRLIANQLNRGEVSFQDFPGYGITDYLYDDAFSLDALYQRTRSVASAAKYILMTMKHAKLQARINLLGIKGISQPESVSRDLTRSDPIELTMKWVGESPDFILKIMNGLREIHGRHLQKKIVVDQARNQGMPLKLVENTIKKLLENGIIYSPKKGIVVRSDW